MITVERLHELLDYNKTTGVFTWRISPTPRIKVGTVAGTNNGSYTTIKLDGKNYWAHRLAWLFTKGSFPKKGFRLVHINGINNDNRFTNLIIKQHKLEPEVKRERQRVAQRGYRTKNLERVRAAARVRSKRHRLNNLEQYRIYQKEYHRKARQMNPERYRKNALRAHHSDTVKKLYNLAKARAKKSGMAFTITKDDITIPSRCPVFGIELQKRTTTGFNDTSPTLDRIDNKRGYEQGNIAVVSWRANRIKCDASLAELKALVAFLEEKLT